MADLDEKLKNTREILQDCQSKKELKTCFDCDDLFDCKIRKDYVDAAFLKMSGGKDGDFEF